MEEKELSTMAALKVVASELISNVEAAFTSKVAEFTLSEVRSTFSLKTAAAVAVAASAAAASSSSL